MAPARYGRALAAALLLLVGCAQAMAIPDQKIGVSRVPDKPLSASLVLPDGPGPFPVVILLHGLWRYQRRRLVLGETADRLGLRRAQRGPVSPRPAPN